MKEKTTLNEVTEMYVIDTEIEECPKESFLKRHGKKIGVAAGAIAALIIGCVALKKSSKGSSDEDDVYDVDFEEVDSDGCNEAE